MLETGINASLLRLFSMEKIQEGWKFNFSSHSNGLSAVRRIRHSQKSRKLFETGQYFVAISNTKKQRRFERVVDSTTKKNIREE